MKKTVKDILTMIKENDIKMVDFKMVDINGQSAMLPSLQIAFLKKQ